MTALNEPLDSSSQPRCLACGAGAHSIREILRSGQYSLLECGRCGLRYSSPMLAADARWYEESDIYKTALAWREKLATGSKPQRWEFRHGLMVLTARGKRLLDLGCGCGEFLFYARGAGCQVTGLDFNSKSVEFARRELNIPSVYNVSLQEFLQAFPDSKFDVISIFEVLEHSSDPGAILCAAKATLGDGGGLLVSVPGYQRWPPLFDPDVDTPPHHLTMWTEKALRAILERFGFKVIAIDRKPLEAGDLGIHLKWTLGRIWRKRSHGGMRPPTAGPRPFGRLLRNLVRRAGAFLLGILCRLLRMYPRAGGFTLLAHARID